MNDKPFLFLIGLFILLIIYKIAWGIFKPKIKGKRGERRVARKLRRLKKGNYFVLNDLLVEYGDNTSQIDHVVISRSGLMVIETKNYDGWIFGSENSKYWTQTFYSNKTKFRNPIKQNWSHVYALKYILSDFGYLKYFPIVVFCGGARLREIKSKLPVIYSKRLTKTIKELDVNPYLSVDKMTKIYETLKRLNVNDRKMRRKHVKQIKSGSMTNHNRRKSNNCPKCGGKLVQRNGKFGAFNGCSNFPECKFTSNIVV